MASASETRVNPLPPQSVAASLRTWGPYGVLVAALAFYGWCAMSAIASPGPQYDELLFVNAALGGHYANGSFVTDRLFGVVTMLMPYVGALKAWIYAPIFELFGVSMSSIRIPVVLVSGATVCIAFALARRLFGTWPAALLAVLMATDATFIAMSKTDYGPIVLSALFRVAALAAYFAWMRTGAVRYACVLGACVALGIFNKVDFLAFAGALAVTAVAFDHRGIVRRVRERPAAYALLASALGAVLLVEYAEIYVPARAFPALRSDAGFSGRLDEVWTLYRATMDGTGFFAYMTGSLPGRRTAVAVSTAGAVALAVLLALWRLVRGRRVTAAEAPVAAAARTTAFLLVLLLATFAVLAATPQAVGPHHAMLLWPLPALLGVSLVSAASRLRPHTLRVGVTAALTMALCALAVSQVRVADTYRSAFASDRVWLPGWTTEAYPLARVVRGAAPGVDRVVVADWGIANQLLAFGDEDVRRRVDDAWGTFAGGDPVAIDQLVDAALRGRRTIVVMHVRGGEVMPGTTTRAEAAIEQLRHGRAAEPLYRGRALLAYLVDDRPRSGG